MVGWSLASVLPTDSSGGRAHRTIAGRPSLRILDERRAHWTDLVPAADARPPVHSLSGMPAGQTSFVRDAVDGLTMGARDAARAAAG